MKPMEEEDSLPISSIEAAHVRAQLFFLFLCS
jgi:hypothetical protein